MLFTGGSRSLRVLRSRVTRLGKAWNKQWGEGNRALSSFNIEALVWEFVDDPSLTLDRALAAWFRYAQEEIDAGKTEDPAQICEPIRLLLPKETVVKRLGSAADRLEEALACENDEGQGEGSAVGRLPRLRRAAGELEVGVRASAAD